MHSSFASVVGFGAAGRTWWLMKSSGLCGVWHFVQQRGEDISGNGNEGYRLRKSIRMTQNLYSDVEVTRAVGVMRV